MRAVNGDTRVGDTLDPCEETRHKKHMFTCGYCLCNGVPCRLMEFKSVINKLVNDRFELQQTTVFPQITHP